MSCMLDYNIVVVVFPILLRMFGEDQDCWRCTTQTLGEGQDFAGSPHMLVLSTEILESTTHTFDEDLHFRMTAVQTLHED